MVSKKKTVLITGVAGFIGHHTAKKFLKYNYNIVGLDNLNHYYDVKIKKDRLRDLHKSKNSKKFTFLKQDIVEKKKIDLIFKKYQPSFVIHLAAQAGVRYSLINPDAYIDSNIRGFFSLLDLSKKFKIKHFVYASTSSVYGANEKIPFQEKNLADHPIQLYAATKRSNELFAHSYSHLYNLPTTGLRFFTVYGPWSRPDMSLYKFADNILKNKPIELFNFGKHIRDFTYVDDIVDGIFKATFKIPKKKIKHNFNKDPSSGKAPFRILNLGNSRPVNLIDYLKKIEKYLNKKSKIKFLAMQKGDIFKTSASIIKSRNLIKYSPKVGIDEGIKNFIDWLKKYKKVNVNKF